MTKKQLMQVVANNTQFFHQQHAIMDAVEAYSSASNGAKPIVSGALPLNSKVIEVAACKAKEFHGGKSAFSAAYEEGWVDGAVWMRTEAEQQ